MSAPNAKPDRNKAILEAYELGASLSQLARAHHLSLMRVRTLVLQAGGKMRPRGGRNNPWGVRGRA